MLLNVYETYSLLGHNEGMSTTMASRIQQHIAQYEQEQAEMGADEPKRNR